MIRYLVLILLLVPIVSADYYADVTIDISPEGSAEIDGVTNHPSLEGLTDSFTFKKQEYWLFNMTFNQSFSDYVFEASFPEGAVINYVKGNGQVNIKQDNGHITVSNFGGDEEVKFLVQYSIEKESRHFMWIVPIAAIVLLVLAFWKFPEKKQYKGLTPRQEQIANLLEKNGSMTQTQIMEKLELPKSSVSRNIEAMYARGVIEKEQTGISNKVYLK